MKNTLYILLIYLLASCSGGSEKAEVEEPLLLMPDKFSQLIQDEPELLLVDVRTSPEYEQGFIEGAVNIDVKDPAFESKVKYFDREIPIAVYCAKGRRSGDASQILKKLGFKKVYDLEGGFTAWSETHSK